MLEDDRDDEKLSEVPKVKPKVKPKKDKKKSKVKANVKQPFDQRDRNKSKTHLMRQIPVLEAELAQIIKFLNDGNTLTKEDFPKILWVNGSENQLKTNGQLKLPPGPHGARQLYRVELDGNKLIVAKENQENYLRNQLLSKDSLMPMTRDSGYHYLKKNVANISRRTLWSFLEKQSVLQVTRNIPDERKKGGIERDVRGHCKCDLIHVNKDLLDDLSEWFRGQIDEEQQNKGEEDTRKPVYFLTLTEQLTGFSCLGFCPAKTNVAVRKVLRIQIKKMEAALKSPVLSFKRSSSVRV